jgi:HSP20 family molecular chaperone IbpA
MKQEQRSAIAIHKLATDDPFLTRAGEMQEKVTQRAAEISREELPSAARHLDHWLRAEAELLQPVALDVRETDDELLVSAKVPGFKESEIELWIDSRRLYIAGAAQELTKQRQGTSLYSEWYSNKIFREFRLPVEIDPAKIEAQLSRGLLEIVFLKPKP